MNVKFKNLFCKISSFFIPLILLIFWQIADNRGRDMFLTSSPKRIIICLLSLARSGELWKHVQMTSIEIILSFVFGNMISIISAILLWRFESLNQIFSPYLVFFNAIPKVALGPLIIIWLGNTPATVVMIALLISTIPCIISLTSAFYATSVGKITLLKTLGATKTQTLTHVVMPFNRPALISSAKVNLGLSFIGVITGEFLVAKCGIGYLITYGGQIFKPDLIISGVFLLAVITICFNIIAKLINKIYKFKKSTQYSSS